MRLMIIHIERQIDRQTGIYIDRQIDSPMNKGVRAIRSELTFNYPFFVYSIISN